MARRPKNPINDILDAAGAWLGGSKGRVTNPQVQAAMDATRAIGKVVDTATGGFGQAVVSDAQRMAASGSSTPSALYKTAAVNLAAGAAGVAAAKVTGKAIEATGIAARRSLNKSGDVLFLHGSETQNIKELKPVKQIIEDMDDLEQPVLTFGQRAHFPKGYVSPSPRTPKDLVSRGIVETADYATDSYNRMTGQPGSIYVARTSKSSIRNPESLDMDFMRRDPNWVHVKNPSKVVSEIKLTPDLLESRKALEAKVRKELRRAGARVPKKK